MGKSFKKEILCTIGPSSRNKRVMSRLEDLGVSLFRINLSHTKFEDLKSIINEMKAYAKVPICLDTEGAQVRTGDLKDGSVFLQTNSVVRICRQPVVGNEREFSFYPHNIADELQIADLISIDFNSVLVQVIEKDSQGVLCRVLAGGKVGQNKAVTVDRDIEMPCLTKKDHDSIKLGMQMGIRHVALSFANRPQDVDYLRSLVSKDTFVISKIESINGLDHLTEIARKSDAILLDRGDMSREVPIEQIPIVQKEIIRRAKQSGAKIYVATNLLESMIDASMPTRAEVNDVFNTLVDGADGLVLAAETAIGSNPVQCAVMVTKIINQYEAFDNGFKFSTKYLKNRHSQLLVDPHGGKLVNRFNTLIDINRVKEYKHLFVDETVLLNAEQIAVGTFSPLEGFMTQQELRSVLDRCSLPNGLIWPLPITLQCTFSQVQGLKIGEKIALSSKADGAVYAVLEIEDIYQYDLDKLSQEVFKTTQTDHSGVSFLKSQGDWFLGGKINLIKRVPSQDKHFEMTPHQARKIFENKGWSRVVGFHTRNVAHRVHEYIQLQALERFHCDGIFIHPLIGSRKKGDYSARVILKSYEMIIDKYYPKNKVLLAAFQSYPRFSGPREAVFTALCRKNFGCSHFIIGRDHSGVGGYYEPDAAHKLFEDLGDIGITPIMFNEIHYSNKLKDYVEASVECSADAVKISGTQSREMLQKGTLPPNWFMREDVSQFIIDEINAGKEVFIE